MLRKLTEPISHADWSLKLLQVEYALNNSVHSEMLFGVNHRGEVVDGLTEYLDEQRVTNRDKVDIRQEASKAIERAQDYACHRAAVRNKDAKEYEVGDIVVILNVDTTPGVNKKFIPKYKGPYVVHKGRGHDRYVIRDVENCQLTKLPYDEVVEANRMRRWLLPLAATEIYRFTDECNTDEDDPDDTQDDNGSDDNDGSNTEDPAAEEDFTGFDESDLVFGIGRGRPEVRSAEL